MALSAANAGTAQSALDPCGGQFELENKLPGTPCVFPLGEAMIQGAYQSIAVPGNTQGPGALGPSFKLPVSARVVGYPASTLYVGVTPRAEIDITPPSFAQVNSSSRGTLGAGALNVQLSYKQLLYVNVKSKTLMAMKLTYKPPTGSPALRGVGPVYQLTPIVAHCFVCGLAPPAGLALALPVANVVVGSTPSAGVQRGWRVAPKLTAFWVSHGGTALYASVQHGFAPNVTPVSFGVVQPLDRHMATSVQYGGLNFLDGPIGGFARTTPTVYPRAVVVNVYYLVGRSDGPPLPTAPAR